MSIEQRLSQLQTLSKRWYPKQSKKFDSNTLVSKVHQQVFHEQVEDVLLDLLINTKYFTNVLWKKFDEDSSVNQVELILAILMYDLEKVVEDTEDCLIQILIEDDRFDVFFTRLLSISYNIHDTTNFRAVSLVLKFLGALLPFVSHPSVATSLSVLWDLPILKVVGISTEEIDTKLRLIEDLPNDSDKVIRQLKSKWMPSMIENFLNLTFINNKITRNTAYFLHFVEQLLYTLATFISNESLGPHLRQMLEKLHFCAIVKLIEPLKFCNFNRIIQLTDTLLYFINLSKPKRCPQESLHHLQQILYSSHKEDPNLKSFFLVPSVQNYSRSTLKEFLALKLSESDLHTVCLVLTGEDSLFLIKECDHKELLLSIILEHVFSDNGLKEFTEVELVDDFFIKPTTNIIDISPLKMPLGLLKSSDDFVKRTENNLKAAFLKEVNSHTSTVLNRMDIDSSLKFQGSSKYFHSINSIEKIDFRTFKLTTGTPVEYNDGLILILELVQPNKFSKFARIKDFGLSLLRLASIKPTSKAKVSNFVIECNSESVESFENRVNYCITLPKSSASKAVRVLQNAFNNPFGPHCESISKSLIEDERVVIPVEKKESPEPKKRKTETSATSNTNELVLNQQQTSVLSSMKSNKFTVVDYKRSTGIRTIVNLALDSLKEERWLVIVPSKAYLRQFLDRPVSESCTYFKYGLDNEWAACKQAIENSILIITSMFDGNTEITNPQALEFYEKEIKQVWNDYLLYNRNSIDALLNKFPFKEIIPKLSSKFNSTPNTFQEGVNIYKNIMQHIKFIKMMFPIWKNPKVAEFDYLFNKYSSIITYEDYLGLVSREDTMCLFESVAIIKGNAELLSVLEKTNKGPFKRVVIAGGPLSKSLQQFELVKLQDKYNIRSEFYRQAHFSEKLPPFNAGFAHTLQFVEVANNIDEAEYCILLYQYMRLLGYPSDKIGIIVRSPYQKVLVEEIAATKCVVDSKSFQFESPSVIFSDARHPESFAYAIVSLHSELPRGFPQLPGTLGNYYIGPSQRTTLQFPSETTLQICAGENYSTRQRTNHQKYSMEGTAHLELYVAQMTKARLASKV